MNTTYDPQALARQFNEDEAVWRQADWIKAAQSRPVRAVGIPMDQT